MQKWLKPIKRMRACEEALEWGEQFGTIEEAWANCEKGDWMLWLAGRLAGDPESESRKRLVLTACECARLALPYVKGGEQSPLKAIETAEQWAKGETNITLSDVRAAAAAAYAAAAAHAYAAYAAAAAAYAAYAAADAAAAAAADDAAAAAAYAAYAAARKEIRKKCADIVRKHYPKPPSRRMT